MRRLATALGIVGGLMTAALPAVAQSWEGVVVGQSGLTAPRAFADAFHVAEALKSGGVDKVVLLRDRTRGDVMDAIDGLRGQPHALVYLAGPLLPDGKGIALRDGALLYQDVIDRLAAAEVTQAALLIEACPAQDATLAAPTPAEGMASLRAASAAPGAACQDTSRMTDLLMAEVTRPITLNELLGEAWVSSDLTEPLTLTPAKAEAAPLTSARVIQPVVSIVDTSMVTLAPVTSLAGQEAVVTPVALQQPAPQQRETGEVVIFAPTAQAQIAALPTAAGLPEPSIIVGLIEQRDASLFQQVSAPGDVGRTEISFENLEARRALRAQDPEQFADLVSLGAFDPPTQLLATALQTELARMKCYTSTIDGIWGGGSRSSVGRYFDEISGVDAVSLEPTTDLFRQIIMQDDIDCPVVAAAPVRQPRATTTRARTNTPRRAAAPKPRAAAPKPKPAAPRRTISSGNSLGVFR